MKTSFRHKFTIMLLFEFRAIFNVKSAGVARLPVCPLADNKGIQPARGHGIISKKRGVMSIADTLTTTAEAYLEKLSEVVKTPDFSITLGGVVLTELADRITSLSVTDNNGFDADQLTLSVDDSDGVTDLPHVVRSWRCPSAGWVRR
nr:Phage protein D [Klebsiella pneumoniae]